jgi:hypothetical protein
LTVTAAAAATTKTHICTARYGGPESNITSWGGGPPVLDPETGKWVLFVTEIAEHCGLSEWQHQSTVVMTTASTVGVDPNERRFIVFASIRHYRSTIRSTSAKYLG